MCNENEFLTLDIDAFMHAESSTDNASYDFGFDDIPPSHISDKCCPEPDGNTYEGWHRKELKCLTEDEAKRLARVMPGMSYFYCEYGNCYHLCKKWK